MTPSTRIFWEHANTHEEHAFPGVQPGQTSLCGKVVRPVETKTYGVFKKCEACEEAHVTLVWKHYVASVDLHTAVTELGSIEIHNAGETVTRGDKTWTLFPWKVKGDGFQVTGVARSLGRAKEDAMAALEILSQRDFEGPAPG